MILSLSTSPSPIAGPALPAYSIILAALDRNIYKPSFPRRLRDNPRTSSLLPLSSTGSFSSSGDCGSSSTGVSSASRCRWCPPSSYTWRHSSPTPSSRQIVCSFEKIILLFPKVLHHPEKITHHFPVKLHTLSMPLHLVPLCLLMHPLCSGPKFFHIDDFIIIIFTSSFFFLLLFILFGFFVLKFYLMRRWYLFLLLPLRWTIIYQHFSLFYRLRLCTLHI